MRKTFEKGKAIREAKKAEILAKVREEMREQVTKQVREQVTEQVREQVRREEHERIRAQLERAGVSLTPEVAAQVFGTGSNQD